MNKLEAQIIIEDTGNYEDEDVEYILEAYNKLLEHIGWADERRDKRFIVKFHNIFYYTPYSDNEEGSIWSLFDDFCNLQYEYITDAALEKNIDIDDMLHPMYVGNYQAFIVYIPEITEQNALDMAMKVYDEFEYNSKEYIENYIYLVNLLQDLEDNYMEYWKEYLEDTDFPKKRIKEMMDKYHKDIERRKATQTLAK